MLGLKHLNVLELVLASLLFLIFFVSGNCAYCQTELTLPPEFQNLSIDSKALNKKSEFTLDSTTIGANQSFVLDKTGFILHLVSSPNIKDENTKIKIFTSDGIEVQTYKFIDDTLFALVDPQQTYSVCEEIMPKCDDLTMIFGFDQASTICPDTELFKLYENIMIDKDTSFKINLRNPTEFYSVALTLPQNTNFLMAKDFSNMKVSLGNSIDSLLGIKRPPVNIANLLPLSTLCLVSKKKTASKTEFASCSFVNSNVNSIITFKNSLTVAPSKAVITVSGIPTGTDAIFLNTVFDNAILKLGKISTDNGGILFSDAGFIEVSSEMDLPKEVKLTVDLIGTAVGISPLSIENILDANGTPIPGVMAIVAPDSVSTVFSSTSTYSTDKDISTGILNVVFSFIPGKFNKLSNTYVFEYAEDVKSQDKPVEISSSSPEKFFFENNDSNFSINLGQISTSVNKNKKNAFSLINPIELNKILNDASFSVSLNTIEPLLTLISNDMSFNAFLNSISFAGDENMLNVYNLSTNNNIVIKNLFDLELSRKNKQRFQINNFDSLIISSYLPENLSSLKVGRGYTFVEQSLAPSVDEKGKSIEVVNNKSKADLILQKTFSNIDLSNQINPYITTVETSSILLSSKLFTMQGGLSGFLVPPDFRPVLEEGYRATVEFAMTINFVSNNETLKIIYADLKTKDETPLTNFFRLTVLFQSLWYISLNTLLKPFFTCY